MADAYRFQQSAGNYYYPQGTQPQHPRHQIIRNSTPPNNTRSPFTIDTPSPSRSPDSHSPAHNPYAMFGSGPGQHTRVNGAAGRGMQQHMGIYNYQQQNSHQQHSQQHSTIQQDSGTHTSNGGALNHHNTYSSGVLNSTTPNFVPASLQNGHAAATRGGQMTAVNPHWAEQVKHRKDAEQANAAAQQGHTHYWARMKAGENRQPVATVPDTQEPESDGDTRISNSNTNAHFQKRQDWVDVDLSGQGLRTISPSFFTFSFLRDVFLGSNKLSYLPPWFGELRQMRHLDVSHNQLTQLPAELGMCVLLKTLLAFDNQIQSLPSELGSLYQLDILGIEGNPALEANEVEEIKRDGTKSLIKRLLEESPMPLPPPDRIVIPLTDASSLNAHDQFRIFSFNILCDNATREQYNYTPAKALEWTYRREMILQQVEKADADIICLQEVDVDSYNEYFRPKLAIHGLKGAFWPKARAKTMSEKDAKVVDGCATFYKSDKYILLDKQLIDFQSIAINRPDMKGQQDVFNRVMPRDQMAILTFFEERLTGSRLVVANGHLYWDPRYADVKLVQAAILMDQINQWAKKYAKWPACTDKKAGMYKFADEVDDAAFEPAPSMEYTDPTQLPLLMCVDLNSTPESSVYQLLSDGRVGPEHEDLAGHSYGNFTRDGIDHPFSLRSAYSLLDDTPHALTFTNYVPGFTGVIDHIFFSSNALEVVSVLGGVDANYMKTVPGFPSYHFPSDHLPLQADFCIKGRKEKKQIPESDFPPSRRDRRD
ncbi:Endonuclease/exonuclease/phosphatase [Bisporella sp. PMI_857]|nr:Endonuclease/exonuclease/phosphatase [Bisporella sp. PMI_857]